MKSDTQRNVGRVLIGLGLVLPVAVWIAGQIWLSNLAAKDPIPDQEAMALAFFAVICSFPGTLILVLIGQVLVRRSILKQT